jgi:hypothetical protein
MSTPTKFQSLQAQFLGLKTQPAAFGRFAGDGRKLIEPSTQPTKTKPMAVTRAQARRVIASFLQLGRSQHSCDGNMVWVIWEWALDVEVRVIIRRTRFGTEHVGFSIIMSDRTRKQFLNRLNLEDYK